MSPLVATPTIFAQIVTKVVDLLRNAFDSVGKAPKWVWNLVAIGLGVVAAFGWQLNLLEGFKGTSISVGMGKFFTGLAIGGMSSGWHELFDSLSGAAKQAHESAKARKENRQHDHGREAQHGTAGHKH